jgi:hypothetical protein
VLDCVLGLYLISVTEDGEFALVGDKMGTEIVRPVLKRLGLSWVVCGGVLRLVEGDRCRFRCTRFLLIEIEVLFPFDDSILDLLWVDCRACSRSYWRGWLWEEGMLVVTLGSLSPSNRIQAIFLNVDGLVASTMA